MKARVALIVVLLVVAIALPVAAVVKKGPPWGYRGHAAVLTEVTGAVEIAPSEAKRARLGDATLKPHAGLFLDPGDEVRVGRYSEARLKLPAGEAVLSDDALVVIDDGGAKGIELKVLRGLVEIALPQGIMPFEVGLPTHDGKITLRPGSGGGSFRIVADGKNEVRAWVRGGSAEAIAAGDANAETGKVLVVDSGRVPRVIDAGAFVPSAVCVDRTLTVTAVPTAQVIALRELRYPEQGKVILELREQKTSVPVFARDVTGKTWRSSVPCTSSAPPATLKKP